MRHRIMRRHTLRAFLVLMLAGTAVACSSEVRVQDATVTLPRVEIVTTTPESARVNGAAREPEIAVVLPTAVSGATMGNTTVVTVIASDGAILRAEPGTGAKALLQIPAGRNLAVVGADISDGTSRWMHVRYGDREGYVRGDLVDTPHLG